MIDRKAGWVLALLVAFPILSGCLGGSKETSGLSSTQTNTSGDNSTILKPPQGREGEFAAFKETNKTVNSSIDGRAHRHDYWGGKTRILAFKGHLEMAPQPNPSGSFVSFHLEPGKLVYEGAGSVEVKVFNPQRHVCEPTGSTIDTKYTCTDGNGLGAPAAPGIPDPNPPTLKLLYRHAATTEWIDAGTLAWNTPLVIPVRRPVETDMPHATTSLWNFMVTTSDSLGNTLTFDAEVTVVHGQGEIALWPGHPDFYADTHERVVFDGESETSEGGFLAGPVAEALGFSDILYQKEPSKLISHGTRTVTVYINITDYKEVPGFGPDYWYLYFHNATGDTLITNPFNTNNSVDTVKNFKFVLKATDEGMDSPYSDKSRWEFMLRGTKQIPPPEVPRPLFTCYGGCSTYHVKYHMKIIASDIVLPDEMYDQVRRG